PRLQLNRAQDASDYRGDAQLADLADPRPPLHNGAPLASTSTSARGYLPHRQAFTRSRQRPVVLSELTPAGGRPPTTATDIRRSPKAHVRLFHRSSHRPMPMRDM